jgi:uncharacterized protein involved in type VI secretion and phage assembly
MMRQMSGVVIGLVKNLDDPDGHGRIQVEFPWMQQSLRSTWAPIAVPLAGKKRGAFFMPELGDEALVAFEHGDFDHPFVIGFLWNGVDEPPSDDIDTKVRRLRTVAGHVLEFDDRSGKEAVRIRTKKDGHRIELEDHPPGKITIKARNGAEIVLEDTPPTITIKAPNGFVHVDCAMADIKAKAMISVDAPLVQFTKVVMAQTVIATSVVGSAYTPAPGNTFGL